MFTYEIKSDKKDEHKYIEITGYEGSVAHLNVPKEIDGISVEAIGNHSFSGRSDLVSVSLPESIRTLYGFAFREVVQEFCRYYQYHPTKTVHYYYDATAKGINYIEKGHDAVFMVKDELQRNGWTVMEYDLGTPMHHDKKHLVINNAFQGSEKLIPMLNKDNNVDLIQAIPLTGYTINTLGFRKDKSGEKTPESPATLPYELRTDGTDAMDTLILGCILRPYDDGKYIYA